MSFGHPQESYIRTLNFFCVEFLEMSILSMLFRKFHINVNARTLLEGIIQFLTK